MHTIVSARFVVHVIALSPPPTLIIVLDEFAKVVFIVLVR